MELVSIGEFARLSRLSAKALRLYDELGLLRPARVDPATGYRWYAGTQVERARLVASLRRIGVPLAKIAVLLDLDPAQAAGQVRAWWVGVEAEHTTRRELAGRLVERLEGKDHDMYQVAVRDMPRRSLLSMLRRVNAEQLIVAGKGFVGRFRNAAVPRLDGVTGAPFVIYHGEVSADSDGPIEWCWPMPDEQATELGARFADLTLRTEPAHQEAFVLQGPAGRVGPVEGEAAVESLIAWATQQRRHPVGGFRQVFVPNPGNGAAGPDSQFAVLLR